MISSWGKELLPVLFVAYLLFGVLLQITVVTGESMEPTFGNGDIILIQRVFYNLKRGDIVVCKPAKYGRPIIKRVIGIEGDRVEIDKNSACVSVNGVLLQEDYIAAEPVAMDMSITVTVQEKCLFVLGDNRNNSLDSRSPEIGQISIDEVVGKNLLTLWKQTS